MGEELKIKQNVNEVIKRKVAESDVAREVKEFLDELLILELEHIDERASWWGWKSAYETLVKKYARSYER